MDLIDDATGETRPLPEPERRLKRVMVPDIAFGHLLFSTQQRERNGTVPAYSFDGIPPDYKVERAFHDLMTGSLCYILNHPTFAVIHDGEMIPEIPCHIRMHRVAVVDETAKRPGRVHATLPEGGQVVSYKSMRIEVTGVVVDEGSPVPDHCGGPTTEEAEQAVPPTEEVKVTFREFL